MATRPSATRSSSNPSVPNPGQPAMPPTGSRAKLVAELLRRAGWRNHQVVRNWPLAASPADDRREHHHGARDDRVAYVLCAQPGVPTAVIATVGAQHGPEVALSRAARQAKRLDAAFAYATNGRQTVRHFPSSGRVVEVDELSNPTSAWRAFARLHALRGRSAVLLGQRYD
ncbi:MAG: hypothetical protein LBO20_06730, partial [Bifidobacteriaceae bacterium]|nr:hypothetical protein [Bifidobacteriaceae bacterium]